MSVADRVDIANPVDPRLRYPTALNLPASDAGWAWQAYAIQSHRRIRFVEISLCNVLILWEGPSGGGCPLNSSMKFVNVNNKPPPLPSEVSRTWSTGGSINFLALGLAMADPYRTNPDIYIMPHLLIAVIL